MDSGFFGTDVKVSYNAETSPDSSGYALTGITYRSDQFAGLKVYLEDKSIDCQITEVNFDPLIGEL